MAPIDVYLCIWGAGVILVTIIQLFVPQFMTSKPLLELLESLDTKKEYFIAHTIISIVFGADLIAAGHLSDDLKMNLCFPLLIAIFISVLITNKLYIGQWSAYVRPTKTDEHKDK